MSATPQPEVVNFIVCALPSAQFGVFEQGFEKSIAEFPELETAEQYALRLAEGKPRWKVDVYDSSGTLTGTYNSEDDAMPKPAAT
jgi:hypothetical protein